MSARKDTSLRRWRRSVKKIGLLAVLAGLAPALSADSHSPAELPDKPATPAAVSAESALSALSDGFLYSDYLQNFPLQAENSPVVSGFHGSFAVENRPSLLESIADGLPARLRQEAQSVPLRQWGLGWAIDSRRPEVTPALAAGGWRLANWLGKEVLLSATDKYGIQTLEFDLQSELGGRRAAIGVNALGALRQTERNAIAWQLSGFKSKDGIGGNVGGLYRWVTPDENHLLGANLFLDYENHDAGTFNRWSLGGEWRSAWVDAFANVYRGITDSKLHKGERYYTADGYELEVNVHSPNVAWIAGALTYYNWKGEDGDSDEDGVRFGLKFTPTLPLLLEVEYDDGDSRDNDWGGRIVYSGEFGGAQSPSVHRRNGEFIPRDFFFIAANRENTQRIRKVEDSDSPPQPSPGRVINLAQRGAAGAAHANIEINGLDITLTLVATPTSGTPTHYIKGGLEFGVSVAASVTVSLAAKYTVQSTAKVVTVQSDRPFVVETGTEEQPRNLFVGSTIALAATYAHLINGQITLASGGGTYEIRRNILPHTLTIATYDSFILPPAVLITVVSPVPEANRKDPIAFPTSQSVRVQRFSDNTTTIRPSSGQVVLTDRLFDSPAVNGRRLSPTGSNGVYSATHRIYAQASQPLTATIRISVLSGYRAKATLINSGPTLTLTGDATFTLTIASPQSTQTQIFGIERDTDIGLPVPVHSNTLSLTLAYNPITPLTNPTFAKIPSDTVLRTFTSLTASAVPIAVLTASGGTHPNYQYNLISGDNFDIVGGRTLQLTAPGYGLYTATVEFANDLSGVPPDAAAAFRQISPSQRAAHVVQVTNIYDVIGGTWNIGGLNLSDDATITIQRVAAAEVMVGTLIASGGDGNYTYTLHGGDATKANIDSNGVLSLPDSTAPGAPNNIDLTVEINDTSDHTDSAMPQNRNTAPITLTLLIRYMQVNDLSHTFAESGGVLRGTVLAAAAIPSAATPLVSVNIAGGLADDSAVVRRTGGDSSFAVSDNQIRWTPDGFGEKSATFQYRDNLTGIPGGTSEKTFNLSANLIRAASLSFDGGHLAPDSGIASLTLTVFFDEEIPQAERSFATLMIATGYEAASSSGGGFFALQNGVLSLNANARATEAAQTGIIQITYARPNANTGAPLVAPLMHRYAVRLEAKYRQLVLQARNPAGTAGSSPLTRVLVSNAIVASVFVEGGRAGRRLQLLANPDFVLASNNQLRLNVAADRFGTHAATLDYSDGSDSMRVTLRVEYADQTPPLVVGFAGGLSSGDSIVLHRTEAGSVRFATLNIGGGLPPLDVGKESASTDYELAGTSRRRILYIPASVEPETGQGKSFAAKITVGDADNNATPAQSLTVNVRYVKVNELASSLTDADGNAGTPLGSVYVFSESELSALRTKLTEMKTTGGSAIRREFLVLEAHKDGTESITDTDRDRNYDIDHTANAANADLYFTPKDGYGTYSVVFKMRDSSVFGDGMIARAGFSPPTKQTLTVHARPIIVSVFAGHRPDRSDHASTVGLTHLPLQSTLIQLTAKARPDLVLTRTLGAGNINDITVAQIHAPPGIRYYGFANNGHLMRLSLPSDEQPPAAQGRIDIIRLGPTSTSAGNISPEPTAKTYTLIMTAHIGSNSGPAVSTVRMEVTFEQELALDFVAPDSTDGTGDPKTFWRGMTFTGSTLVLASVVLGGTNPVIRKPLGNTRFRLMDGDKKIGFVPDRFGIHTLTVQATEDGGLTAEKVLMITVRPTYEVYGGDQKIEETGDIIRFTVSVAFQPITSPVRIAELRFLGDDAATFCNGASATDGRFLAFQREGASCHLALIGTPNAPQAAPDNRVLEEYVSVPIPQQLEERNNYFSFNRNIQIQIAPAPGVQFADPSTETGNPRTVFVDTQITSNDSVEVATAVVVAESSNPQVALLHPANNPFRLDNNRLLHLRPTRYGPYTATVRATDGSKTAETVVTVEVNRAFRVFPGGGDDELTYPAASSSEYRLSAFAPFGEPIFASLTLAELRGFNDDVCDRSESPLNPAAAARAPGGVAIVKNGASCHLILNPGPALNRVMPDNRELVFDWELSNPGSNYRFLDGGAVKSSIFVNIAPIYSPIQLELAGAGGSAQANTVVVQHDAVFGNVAATGGNGNYTYERIGVGSGRQITVAANGDLHFNVAENAFGEQTITVKVTDTAGVAAGLIEPASITVTANYIDIPYILTDYRGNVLSPVIANDIHEIRFSVYGPDTATWGSAPLTPVVSLVLKSGATKSPDFCTGIPAADCEANIEFVDATGSEGAHWSPAGSAKLEAAPGHEEGIRFAVSQGGAVVLTVWLRAYFIRTPDLALGVEKPIPAAAGPVRWFTGHTAGTYSLVASLDVSGGGAGRVLSIAAAPSGDVFDIDANNILRFRPPVKGLYTVTLTVSDNIDTTPVGETVTVGYGDPIVATMQSGGRVGVSGGTLSSGATVIFHNYVGANARLPLADLPIATIVAAGGLLPLTYRGADSSSGGDEFIEMGGSAGNVIMLNRVSGSTPSNGNGVLPAGSPFVFTVTVDDGFDASPSVVFSITGRTHLFADSTGSENPKIRIEDNGKVIGRHTDTSVPQLTLGLPSPGGAGVIATLRLSDGVGSKGLTTPGGNSPGLSATDRRADGSDLLYNIRLASNVNMGDFPANAEGESGLRTGVFGVDTDDLGTDFFTGESETDRESVTLRFKIKKIVGRQNNTGYLEAANNSVPSTVATGNLFRRIDGKMVIFRSLHLETFADKVLADITFSNLVRLGGEYGYADLPRTANSRVSPDHPNAYFRLENHNTNDDFVALRTRADEPAAHEATQTVAFAFPVGNSQVGIEGGTVVLDVHRWNVWPIALRIYASATRPRREWHPVPLNTDTPPIGALLTPPYEFHNGQNTKSRHILGELYNDLGIGVAATSGGTGGQGVRIEGANGCTYVNKAPRFVPRQVILSEAPENCFINISYRDNAGSGWPAGVDFSPDGRVGVNFTHVASGDVSCKSGGLRGDTNIFTEVAAGTTVGPNNALLRLDQGLIAQMRQGNRGLGAVANIHAAHASTRGHIYTRCRGETGGGRDDVICSYRFANQPNGPDSPIRAGDVVLVASGFRHRNNILDISHAASGGGRFDNVLNFVKQRVNNNEERHTNLYRVYHKLGVKKPGSNQLEYFLARGAYSGHDDAYEAGCFTEDLPDGGPRFYLDHNYIRTYKWRESTHKSRLGNHVTDYNRPGPATAAPGT